jgi:hypothetical protein
MKFSSRNLWSGVSRIERLSLLVCIGSLGASLWAEQRLNQVSSEISETTLAINRTKAVPIEVVLPPGNSDSESAIIEARINSLREQEKVARASCKARVAAEAMLKEKYEDLAATLSVRPDSKRELARKISNAASICAANRFGGGLAKSSLGNEPEARLVLVRCVGECRRMERNISDFSEFLAELVIQFYGLDSSHEGNLRALIADGFEAIRKKSLASTDRPEPGSEGWETGSLEWESRRDEQILAIAKSIGAVIPENHPYRKWLPSLLSLSSGLRGRIVPSKEGAASKSTVTVGLPLSPEE